jgi:hypothetical protein
MLGRFAARVQIAPLGMAGTRNARDKRQARGLHVQVCVLPEDVSLCYLENALLT